MKQILTILALLLSMTLVAQNNVKRIWTNPYVLTSADEEFSFQIELKDNVSLIDSIVVEYNSFNSLVFLDDGLNADMLGSDNVFTSKKMIGLNIVNQELIYTIPFSWEYKVIEVKVYSGGVGIVEDDSGDFTVNWFTPEELPKVYQRSEYIQHTSHVVNIVNPGIEYSAQDIESDLAKYFEVLEDDRHTMAIVSTETSRWTPNDQAQSFTIKNEVHGIGYEIKDNASEYGASNIENIIYLFGRSVTSQNVFLHEIHHKFAFRLPQELNLSIGSHPSGVNSLHGNGFGVGYHNIVSNGDSTYNIEYQSLPSGSFNPLDMYVSGYGTIDDINFPIEILPSFSFLSTNPDGTNLIYSEDTLMLLTEEHFVNALGGLRIPSFENARKVQNIALVVRSQQFLTPKELAFYHQIMVEHEKTETNIYSPNSYYERTYGIGKLNTQIYTEPTDVENIEENSDIIIFPNPTSKYINIQTFPYNSFSLNKANVVLYNSSGQIAIRVNSYTDGNTIDINGLSSGVYILEVLIKDKKFLKTLVIQ